jgi:hypothetical protein
MTSRTTTTGICRRGGKRTGMKTPSSAGNTEVKQHCNTTTWTLRIFDNNKKVNLFIQISSFKELQKLFLIWYDQGIIDDEPLLFLYCSYDSKNPDFPYELYPDFNLHDMDEDECLAEFRFRKQDILILAKNLQIPQSLLCEQRSMCDGLTGLCMLFKRLSYPCK